MKSFIQIKKNFSKLSLYSASISASSDIEIALETNTSEILGSDKSKSVSLTLVDLNLSNKDCDTSGDIDLEDEAKTTYKPMQSLSEPFEYPAHKHNSTIARAYWFVNNKKVSHNFELKIYNVKDERENIFQVELLPQAKCSCVATFQCAHILAVQYINGISINEIIIII